MSKTRPEPSQDVGRLWHWTCRDHGERALGRSGMLMPRFHPILGYALAWLTDDPYAGRQALSRAKCFAGSKPRPSSHRSRPTAGQSPRGGWGCVKSIHGTKHSGSRVLTARYVG